MDKPSIPVVNVVVKSLVVVNREITINDKPAGAGMFKKVLVGFVCACMPYLVSEAYKWMSYFNLS